MADAGYDAVVVGCGALGLNTARELARRGARVLAVDRALPGSQTSARAAGQSVVVQADDSVGQMMTRSVQAFVELADDADDFEVHRVGSIKLACADWAARQLHREVARATDRDIRVELITSERAAELAPWIDPGHAQLGWYTPDDLYFHPPDYLAALLATTRSAGVDIRSGIRVDAIVTKAARVIGVDTDSGLLRADNVVVAAGPWSLALLGRLGIDLPITAVRHQFTVRGPDGSVDPSDPVVRVVDDAIYARPNGRHLVLGRYEPQPLVIGPSTMPADTADLPVDEALLDDTLVSGELFARPMAWPLAEIRAGVVTMTPDGGYIVDDGHIRGLHFVTGDNVRGLTVSPAMGQDVAEWIRTGRRPTSLAPFSLDRFTAPPTDEDEASSLRYYATIYLDDESIREVGDRATA